MKKLILLSAIALSTFSVYSQTTDSSTSTQPPSAGQTPATQAPPPAKPAAVPATAPASAGQAESEWKFGLHATPSIKWLSTSTDGLESDGAQVGFSYGLVAEYFFQSRYSFCTGIDFAYRGGKIKSKDFPDIKFATSLQYLEIPVTIKMHTNEMNKKLFYAKFGVSPGWYIGSTGDDVASGYTDFYTALKIGGGMEYEISDETMLFGGLVWNNGFTDAFKSGDFNAKNKSVELEIGVLF